MKQILTTEDPEKLKAEAEKAENEKLKAQRRLEAKRRSALEAEYENNYGYASEEDETRYRQGNEAMIRELDGYKEAEDDFGIFSIEC